MTVVIRQTDRGLYCPAGDFHVDPWQPVERAIITHAHSDHARAGSRLYFTATPGERVLQERIGHEASIQTLPFGEQLHIGDALISLHPAGHLLGSAQVRIEAAGEVCVISGDYKVQTDSTCENFDAVPCDVFITESTFGLPIYRWKPQEQIFAEINQWWRENQELGRTSVIFAYALGKAQRVLGNVDASIGPVIVHGAVSRFLPAYEAAGIKLAPALRADPETVKATRGRALVIAPPSAAGSPWLRKFGEVSTAMASGWMQIRGTRRRSNVDRGFVLSDHADWDGLLAAIRATGAGEIGVTHGYTAPLSRFLNENGWSANVFPTRFSNAGEDDAPESDDVTQPHGTASDQLI